MDQIDRLINREGGDRLVKLKGDTGGWTKYGISQNNHPEVDVAHLTYDEAREIYEKTYLIGPKIDKLPQPLQEQVFDFAVHSGPMTAIKKLQCILNAPETGIIDKNLIDSLQSLDIVKINNALVKLRILFLLSLNYPQFWRGWIRRAISFMV